MNLAHLRYFVKLAHEKHYTKAAEQLCITQPSLSHAISTLEKSLGVQLFEKNNRNTELTNCGKQFLSCVESSLAILDNGIESLTKVAKGEGLIRIGFLRTLGVNYIPTLIAQYLEEHPDKNIEFHFDVDLSPRLLEGLKDNKLDVVFASKSTSEEIFDCVPVKKQNLVLIVPKEHPLADRFSISLSETESYPYILFDSKSGLYSIIHDMLKKAGIVPKIAYEISEDQVIAGMVAKNFGIAIVPYMDILLQLDVKILSISYPQYERKFYMITNNQLYLPPVIQDFRKFVMSNSNNEENYK